MIIRPVEICPKCGQYTHAKCYLTQIRREAESVEKAGNA